MPVFSSRLVLSAWLAGASCAALAMPDLSTLQAAIRDNPEWQVADSRSTLLQREASLRQLSPHDWQAALTTQQRQYSAGVGRVQEWSLRVERGWRLADKAALDAAMADTLRRQAALHANAAERQLVQEALSLWLDSAALAARRQLQQQLLDDLRSLLTAQQKQVKAGELAQRDVVRTQAELASLQDEDLRMAGEQALADEALEHHYPRLAELDKNLPDPQAPGRWTREQVAKAAEQASETQLAGQDALLARQEGQRLQADRLPDPQIGVFMAHEAIPGERVVGVSVTVPLPGSRRQAQAHEAEARANWLQAQQEMIRQTQLHTSDIYWLQHENAWAAWQESHHHMELTEQAATMARKAYLLGEGSLEEAAQARRLWGQVRQQELEARVAVIRAQELLKLRVNNP